MSTVLEPPEASPRTDAAGAGAGEREGPGIVQAELPDGMFPPLAEPFAGWMCLADCASDVAPGAGDVMRSAALLVRSAIEAQTPELGQAITRILSRDGDLAGPVVDTVVERMLQAGRLAQTPALAAQQLADSVHDLDAEDREQIIRLSDNSFRLLEQFGGAPAVQPYEGLSGRMLSTAGACLGAQAAQVTMPGPGDEPEDFYFGRTGPRWWFTASLELPQSIGGREPVFCARPQHRLGGDQIRVIESTYQNLDVDDALKGRDVRSGHVPRQYRGSLRADQAERFDDLVGAPADYKAYVCRALIEPDSRAIRSVGQIVARHQQEIADVLGSATQSALSLIATAHPAAVLTTPLLGLLGNLIAPVTEHLVTALANRVGPRTLPAWVISHTVVWANPAMPLSIFLLRCPDESVRRMRLHGIRGADASGRTLISADYGDLPKALYNQGRLMWSASRPDPARPGLPDDLWSVVDGADRPEGRGEPVIWTQPEFDRRGFRVLVPQQYDNARYVTALRADIRFT